VTHLGVGGNRICAARSRLTMERAVSQCSNWMTSILNLSLRMWWPNSIESKGTTRAENGAFESVCQFHLMQGLCLSRLTVLVCCNTQAQSIGLNKDPASGEIDTRTRRLRSRLWWCHPKCLSVGCSQNQTSMSSIGVSGESQCDPLRSQENLESVTHKHSQSA
jgi:hypothetical protein